MFLATQRRLLARVLHSFRPTNYSWAITKINEGFCRNKIQVQHLVACRTKQNKIGHVIVFATAVKMCNLQNLWYAEATMSTEQSLSVVLERNLSIINALHFHTM